MKAQMKAVMASAVVIVLALAAVSGVTYSWWSDTDESVVSIESATIDIDAKFGNATVTNNSGDPISDTLVSVNNDDLNVNNLVANRTITFKLSIEDNSTIPVKYRLYLDLTELAQYSVYISLFNDNELLTSVNGITYIVGGSSSIVDYPDTDPEFNLKMVVSETATAFSVGSFSIGAIVEAYQSDATVDAPEPSTGEAGQAVNLNGKTAVQISSDMNLGVSTTLVAFDSASRSNVDSVTVNVSNISSQGFNVTGNVCVDITATGPTGNITQLGGTATITIDLNGEVPNPVVTYVDENLNPLETMVVTDVRYDSSADKTYVTFVTNHFSKFMISTLFHNGIGTSEKPFIIANADQMRNITKLYDQGYYYFKVKDGVKSIDCSNWSNINLQGFFDGNGVNFVNLSSSLFRNVGIVSDDDVGYTTIKNLSICDAKIINSGYASALARNGGSHLIMEGINITGYIEGSGVSSFIVFGPNNLGENDEILLWSFIDCVSSAILVETSDCAAGFIKHPYCNASQNPGSEDAQNSCLITIEDSIFNGKIYSDSQTKYFIGNGNAMRVCTIYSDEFIGKYGNPDYFISESEIVKVDNIFYTGNYPTTAGGYDANKSNYCVDKYIVEDKTYKIVTSKGITPSIGEAFNVEAVDDASSASAILLVAPNDKSGSGSYLGTYMEESLTLNGGSFTTDDVRCFTITVNDSVYTGQGVFGNNYNVSDEGAFYGNTYNSAFVNIIQYNSDGEILAITMFKLN